MLKLLFALSGALLAASCSMIEPIPGANEVILSNDPASCETLKKVEISVRSTVLYMERSKATTADELRTLAQNTAVKAGGNAIWPESEIKDGKQMFSILRCSPSR